MAPILIDLVAAEHLYILWMEMFAWTTKRLKFFNNLPKGRTTQEQQNKPTLNFHVDLETFALLTRDHCVGLVVAWEGFGFWIPVNFTP